MLISPINEGYRRSLMLIGCVAAVLYSNFLLDWLLRGFDGMGIVVSQLEAPGQPHATFLRVTDVLTGVLVLLLLPGVRRAMPAGGWRYLTIWATVVFAVGAIVAAVVALPCGPAQVCATLRLQTNIHDGSSVLSDTGLFIGSAAAWFATRRAGPIWFQRAATIVFWFGGIAASAVFGYINLTQRPLWAVGTTQRIHILWISVWILCLAVYAAQRPGRGERAHLSEHGPPVGELPSACPDSIGSAGNAGCSSCIVREPRS
jgi:hypothetical protein